MADAIRGLNRTDHYLEKGVQKVILVTEATDADRVIALEQRVQDLEHAIDAILTEVLPNIVR